MDITRISRAETRTKSKIKIVKLPIGNIVSRDAWKSRTIYENYYIHPLYLYMASHIDKRQLPLP